MKNKYITLTLGIIMILSVVTISGCTTNENQTYLNKAHGWSDIVTNATINQQQANQDYLAGFITTPDFINKTHSHKKTIDNVIAKMEKTTPPSGYLQIHDDILLAFKDYSNNLQQTMQGINLNNINITFTQSLDSMHESNVKIEQALQNLDK